MTRHRQRPATHLHRVIIVHRSPQDQAVRKKFEMPVEVPCGKSEHSLTLIRGGFMSKVVCDISVSADGYVAGPNQTREKPFGDGPVERLHAWMFDTPDENKAESCADIEDAREAAPGARVSPGSVGERRVAVR
jgi:hypothetical protein